MNINLNEKEVKLLLYFLKDYSEILGNNGCNDLDPLVWKDWSLEEKQEFLKEFNDMNNTPEEYDPERANKEYFIQDFSVLHVLQQRLKDSISFLIPNSLKNRYNFLLDKMEDEEAEYAFSFNFEDLVVFLNEFEVKEMPNISATDEGVVIAEWKETKEKNRNTIIKFFDEKMELIYRDTDEVITYFFTFEDLNKIHNLKGKIKEVLKYGKD
jgi:hypothetical protein